MKGPDLDLGRKYYCLSDELKFNCTGPGKSMQWDVPTVFNNRGFGDFDSPPINTRIGDDALLHLNRSTPTFFTTLTIRGVPEITVICSTDFPDNRTASPPPSSKYIALFVVVEYNYMGDFLNT